MNIGEGRGRNNIEGRREGGKGRKGERRDNMKRDCKD